VAEREAERKSRGETETTVSETESWSDEVIIKE